VTGATLRELLDRMNHSSSPAQLDKLIATVGRAHGAGPGHLAVAETRPADTGTAKRISTPGPLRADLYRDGLSYGSTGQSAAYWQKPGYLGASLPLAAAREWTG
jgi:hypothetical protein